MREERLSPTAAVPVRLNKVPPFPPVATRLIGLLNSEEVNLSQVERLISADPILAARILQYANSAEFGLLLPIQSVRHGLTTLGLDRTRKITVTLAMGAYTKASLGVKELRRCWQHSVATAVLSDLISRTSGVFTELAYTAGIMHDIGRLGLLVAYPKEYEETIRTAWDHCLDLLDFERERFGMDHAEAGRWLAEKWKLAPELTVAAGRHHDSCEGTAYSLLRIIHIACRMADCMGYEVAPPLVTHTFQEIAGDLPDPVRGAVAAREAEFRAEVERTVEGFSDGPPRQADAAKPEEPEGTEAEAGLQIELPLTPAGQPDAGEAGGGLAGWLRRIFGLSPIRR